jgi:ubiquinone biosynthesis protein
VSSRPAVRQLGRLSEIAQVAAKHGFGYVFETRGFRRSRRETEREADTDGAGSPRGVRLREMLDELGPTFVKFGQLLSLRPDVVPPDVVLELKALQDQVTPFPFDQVREVVEADLELSLEQLFVAFDEQPIAAASIGQVHRATLPNGNRVAVKVQRPDAPRQVEADLELMYQAARFVRDRVKALEFIDTVSLVDEFARTIRAELDYRAEARNAEQFHRDFAADPHVRVPQVYWTYSSSRVLTLEFLDGAQLRDVDLEHLTLEDRRQLAYRITETWMAMIFRHGFFHGDPHPANVMVLDGGETIGLVDFGMTGKLSADDMTKLTSLFIDASQQNIEALPRRLAALGVRYPRELEDEFVAELQEVFEKYYGARLDEIDPIQLIREVFGLIYRMHLHLPTRFVLLDRAIATLASVGIELYPEFNVFEVARPYARDLLIARFSPQRIARRSQQEVRNFARMAYELPYQLHDVLDEVRDGRIEIGFHHRGIEDFIGSLDKEINRLVVAIVTLGVVLGSALIAGLVEGGPQIFGMNVFAVAGFGAAFFIGAWLVWGIIRSGRI